MQRYTNFIASTTATNSTLTVLSNASCVVYIAGTLGAATLYSDNGVTPLANPFLSSATGRIDFYAANGRYDVVVSKLGYLTVTISDIELDDLLAPSGSNSVGYLPAGTGAVASTVQTKLRESVSVKDFGAVGNGSTDDTAAIQAAITANGGKVIFFPVGTYKITSTILISAASTRLVGASARAAILNAGSGDAFKFYSILTAQTDFLSNCAISGFYIYHAASATTTGAGVRLVQCNSFSLDDVYVLAHPEGIRVLGGQLNNLTNFQIFASAAMADISGTTDSAMLALLETPTDGATYQPCYTVRLSNFTISASLRTQTSVLIGNADGLQVVNAYINAGLTSLWRFKNQRDGSYIAGVTISNVYFDCVANATSYVMDAPADGFASAFVYHLNLSNCFLGGCNESGLFFSKTIANLVVAGCSFENIGKSALDSTNTSSSGNCIITGCELNSVGTDGLSSGLFKFNNGLSVTVTGNKFAGAAGCGAAIDLAGTISCATITGNTIRLATTDIANAATVANLIYSGNNSVNTAAATSLKGVLIGNQPNNNTLVLDWYEEGTITPTLTFGGAAVGVTYTVQTGSWTRIGNRVMFQFSLTLSSKGVSVGNLLIPNVLPYTASTDAAVAVRITNMTAGVGDTMIAAIATGTTKNVRIDETTAGFVSILTDVDFSNTSGLLIAGQYLV